ncbi:MAG TPA: DUF2470 domain-containing protein [Mycobacteriales bacterium]|nr:DUF2470 domain-containing protein [Mycobacteriales bacterium]
MAPDDAALARTSLASARAGTLVTFGRQARGHLSTLVQVAACPDGNARIALAPGCPALSRLTARPLAVLRVAPAWCAPVALHGGVRRLPGRDEAGRVCFLLHAALVRLGRPCRPVDAADYAAAAPDPLHAEAAGVLSHLNAAHTEQLAACLRARGHAAAFVQAAGLDSGGLTVVAVSTAGAQTVRLDFPYPVSRLAELPGGLAPVVSSGCVSCCRR